MAAEPILKSGRERALRLRAFEPRYAARVVSWVRGSREAYWLAPRTKPPLTAAKVCAWSGPGRSPLMLMAGAEAEPLAYGELNLLNEACGEYWLGHLVVDPWQRGCGLGRRLTELLLQRAFQRCGARRVSLVVFPDNHAAIGCYRAAGLVEDGHETHWFAPYRRHERLLRLVKGTARVPHR